MRKSVLRLSSVILFSSLLSACAGSPPDVAVCTEVTMTRGTCVKTVSGEAFDIDDEHMITLPTGEKVSWWQIRPYMLQLPYYEWAKLKAWIIKTCKQTKQCDESITSWQRTVETIDKHIQD